MPENNDPLQAHSLKELEPLILDGISQILERPGVQKRDFNKKPLCHKEITFLIQTLHLELNDPNLQNELVYLYGRMLDYLSEKVVYN